MLCRFEVPELCAKMVDLFSIFNIKTMKESMVHCRFRIAGRTSSALKALHPFHFRRANAGKEVSGQEKTTKYDEQRALWERHVLLFLQQTISILAKC